MLLGRANAFLSCLGGSELAKESGVYFFHFLSCLGGSELAH